MFKKFLKPKITILMNNEGNQVRSKLRKVKLEDFIVMMYYTIRYVISGIDGMDFNRFMSQLKKVDQQVKQSEKKNKKNK